VCLREILREIPCHMPFRQTIAAKIFGLAIILLLLTIALAGEMPGVWRKRLHNGLGDYAWD
jgi:hypothetical protein